MNLSANGKRLATRHSAPFVQLFSSSAICTMRIAQLPLSNLRSSSAFAPHDWTSPVVMVRRICSASAMT